MELFITMLVLGFALGFVGGGGSGFVLALLISMFHIPVHTALATSITSMIFTAFSGTMSHLRGGNVLVKTGLIVGVFGAMGSYIGTMVASKSPAHFLVVVSASLLFLSSFLIWLKTRMKSKMEEEIHSSKLGWIMKPGIGLVTGFLSGCFGIGSTPLIQLGLIVFLHLTIRQAAATSMLILMPISFFGAVGYYQAGLIDWLLLLKIVIGTMTGSYLGAKLTNKAPVFVLRTAIICLPIFGGILMLQ